MKPSIFSYCIISSLLLLITSSFLFIDINNRVIIINKKFEILCKKDLLYETGSYNENTVVDSVNRIVGHSSDKLNQCKIEKPYGNLVTGKASFNFIDSISNNNFMIISRTHSNFELDSITNYIFINYIYKKQPQYSCKNYFRSYTDYADSITSGSYSQTICLQKITNGKKNNIDSTIKSITFNFLLLKQPQHLCKQCFSMHDSLFRYYFDSLKYFEKY